MANWKSAIDHCCWTLVEMRLAKPSRELQTLAVPTPPQSMICLDPVAEHLRLISRVSSEEPIVHLRATVTVQLTLV
jgi:hypothetical protein